MQKMKLNTEKTTRDLFRKTKGTCFETKNENVVLKDNEYN